MGKRAGRFRFRRYAMYAAAIYSIWLGVLYVKQDSMVFPRQYAGPAMKEGRLPAGVESVWINAGTEERPVRVEAWFLLPEGAKGAVSGGVGGEASGEAGGKVVGDRGRYPAVVYLHGNAELIDDNVGRAQEWARRGFAVLLPEYRGYGRSGGAPSQAAITEDVVRFYDWLVARPEIDPGRVVVHGRSLGGGVAAQLAARRPTAGLVLESTMTSVACFAWGVGGVPWICRHPFRTDEALRGYEKPVLIFHGRDDEFIPVSHGRRLAKLLERAVYVETAGDHMNYPPDLGEFWGRIDEFVEWVR